MRIGLVISVVAVLLVGEGLGYFLGYATYQPRIVSLQNDLDKAHTENAALNSSVQKLLAVGGFTLDEKLEFISAYATKSAGTFTIHLIIRNMGVATATIDIASLLINGIPTTGYVNQPVVAFNDTVLDLCEYASGTITLTESSEWVSGMTIEIMIHTLAGYDYPKVVPLP
jgi:hypothetical protein